MTSIRFGHVGLIVRDANRTALLYADVFGFQEFFRIHRDSNVETNAWLRRALGTPGIALTFVHMRLPDAGMHLELIQPHYPIDHRVPDGFCRPGKPHFCLVVQDIEDVLARAARHFTPEGFALLTAAGTAMYAQIEDGPNKGAKIAFLIDPDGNYVELFQSPENPHAQ